MTSLKLDEKFSKFIKTNSQTEIVIQDGEIIHFYVNLEEVFDFLRANCSPEDVFDMDAWFEKKLKDSMEEISNMFEGDGNYYENPNSD